MLFTAIIAVVTALASTVDLIKSGGHAAAPTIYKPFDIATGCPMVRKVGRGEWGRRHEGSRCAP